MEIKQSRLFIFPRIFYSVVVVVVAAALPSATGSAEETHFFRDSLIIEIVHHYDTMLCIQLTEAFSMNPPL